MSNKQKISKNKRYDDPTAFSKRFPKIRKQDTSADVSSYSESILGVDQETYKMGKLKCIVYRPSSDRPFYFMSVVGKDTYPTWDEIVWLRYNLIPDSAVMALLLPNLNVYINDDKTGYKFVFTMEQTGWALDPRPTCMKCNSTKEMSLTGYAITEAEFLCLNCDHTRSIDMRDWNEINGNGKLAK